ncbi:hypothetical protein JYT43_00085 [Ahrensia sp. AH-315-G08]|nr:hypothetical protein [Ahrensia sp. AH-315-G08]
MFWVKVAIWVICLSPIWGALAWELWAGAIKPRLIPDEQIEALAKDMISVHGNRAAEFAFIKEDRAWRYSDSFEQGKWRRVRHQIRCY